MDQLMILVIHIHNHYEQLLDAGVDRLFCPGELLNGTLDGHAVFLLEILQLGIDHLIRRLG
jgi:hypothetical protein